MNARDEQNLYLAIGSLVTNWGFIESNSALVTNALYSNVVIDDRPRRMPMFIRDQHRLIRQSLLDVPTLSDLRDEGINLLDRTAQQRDLREHFVHSVLTGFDQSRGVYSFTRLDAKDQEHLATDWEFDAQSFPGIDKRLLSLVAAWREFTIKIALRFDGQSEK